MPVVPILKKPKLHKIIVTKYVAILTEAKYFTSDKCPINAVSTTPTKGIATFAKKIGMESLNKWAFETFDGYLILSKYALFITLFH